MDNKLLYIKEKDFVATAHYEEKIVDIYSSMSYINFLAKNHFFKLSEYYKLVRHQLKLKNKIPIYFSDKLLLFKMKCSDGDYYFNYFEILKICIDKEKIVIIFKSLQIVNIIIRKAVLQHELKKIDVILNYISLL